MGSFGLRDKDFNLIISKYPALLCLSQQVNFSQNIGLQIFRKLQNTVLINIKAMANNEFTLFAIVYPFIVKVLSATL